MPEVTAWQNRPLEKIYPFIFMDAIHYKVKEDHRYMTKAAYVVLGITMDGRKDILGVWIGEHESSKFWLNVLNDLKSRGVLDVYLFCTDGLCGMMQAIQAVYPKSRLQRCIVHQIRSSTRFVNWKDIKQVVADLKKIYTAVRFRESENMILKNGWYQVKQKGSHHQYKHPTKPGKVTIPEHGGDLNPDTVKSILKQAGL